MKVRLHLWAAVSALRSFKKGSLIIRVIVTSRNHCQNCKKKIKITRKIKLSLKKLRKSLTLSQINWTGRISQ